VKKVLAWVEVEAHRALLYRLVVALIPVAVAGGLLSNGDAQVVLTYAGVLLGFGATGLAVRHTKRSPRA
jgi:hypothetical protein